MTHILKCMLKNDVFVNVKPNKMKENKEIKVQKNIKKISAKKWSSYEKIVYCLEMK